MARYRNSSDIPTKTIENMVDFITVHLPKAAAACFIIEAKPGGRCTAGLCREVGPGIWPVQIELSVPPAGARSFPDTEQYVPYLPSILLRSREEEILLVLAHECRHAHQFTSRPTFDYCAGLELEEDAEEFAYQLLFRWRLKKPSRCRIVPKERHAR